jgi:hypothetical protein
MSSQGCVQISGRTLSRVAAKNRSLFSQNLREGALPPKMNAPVTSRVLITRYLLS